MHDMGLPLADPETFLDQHRSKLGINARNIFHIAPQVSAEVPLHSPRNSHKAFAMQKSHAL